MVQNCIPWALCPNYSNGYSEAAAENVDSKWHWASLVMKQADRLQPWTMSFRARAKSFDFKLNCSRILPICKLLRLSIRLQLRPFILEFEFKPESARKLSDLKFLRIFKGFHRRRSENKGIVKTWLARKNNLFGRRKTRACLWVLLFAIGCCFVIVQLSSYFRGGFFWGFFWMGWNYFAPSGSLSEVICDGLSRCIGF